MRAWLGTRVTFRVEGSVLQVTAAKAVRIARFKVGVWELQRQYFNRARCNYSNDDVLE